MEAKNNYRYQSLRDLQVPIAILDVIFSNDKDLEILNNAWDELKTKKLSNDEISKEISKLIFKGLDLKPPNIILIIIFKKLTNI